MRIAIGSDHRGYEAKERIKALLLDMGLEIDDMGVHGKQAADYPDTGLLVADTVAHGRADRGILFCGSGIGMSITANKVRGIRAALCHDELTAQMSRRHNDANILCLPADLVGDALMQGIVRSWLTTDFEGGRHARRVEKIVEFERRHVKDEDDAADCLCDDAGEQAPRGREPKRAEPSAGMGI